MAAQQAVRGNKKLQCLPRCGMKSEASVPATKYRCRAGDRRARLPGWEEERKSKLGAREKFLA